MPLWKSSLAVLLIAALAGCGSADESVRPDAPSTGVYEVEADASPEDLYFELVRLNSAGLLEPGRMDAIHRALDELDEKYEEGTESHHEQMRVALASALRRALRDMRQHDDAAVAEAQYEGRAYAGKLNRAGVREAERHAENTLLIAGMMGVPTSEGDMVLMVAIPVGGYLVVRATGVAFKRLPLLLRKLRSADDIPEEAVKRGFRWGYASNPEEMRALGGELAARIADNPPPHVGAAETPRKGKLNRWNPSDRTDNCTACVAAVIRNSIDGYFNHTAEELERLFGYAGRERRFSTEDSLHYIENATGLQASKAGIAILDPRAPAGHYAIFTKWEDGDYRHVVYGRVTPTGRVVVFDPQSMERMTYQQLLKRHGKARPHLLEEPHE
jgi:hypothetical protein